MVTTDHDDGPRMLPGPSNPRFESEWIADKLNEENEDLTWPEAKNLVKKTLQTGRKESRLAERAHEEGVDRIEALGYDWDQLQRKAKRVKRQKIQEKEERLSR